MVLIFSVIIVIFSLLITFVVLIQKSKGGGLTAGFQSSNQIMGTPQTTNFLEKGTWYLMGIIAVLCIASTLALKHSSVSSSTVIEAQEQTANPTLPEGVAEDAAPVEAPAADGAQE